MTYPHHNSLRFFVAFTAMFTLFQSSNLQATTIFVNANVTGGTEDGTSWDNAFPDLQTGLSLSEYGDEIWVAQSTYLPTTDTNRNAFFRLPNGVKLYGGFNGTETSLDQRDWLLYPTILSGDIGVQGDSTDNVRTVVFTIFCDSTTVLDGFTIKDGNADETDFNLPFYNRSKSGGGMYIHGQGSGKKAAPRIRNCRFEHNTALQQGGGIYINGRFDGSSAALVEHCLFINNRAGSGGGISKNGGSFGEEVHDIRFCTFEKNLAVEGGGIYFEEEHGNNNCTLHHCEFKNNQAYGGGGIRYFGFNSETEFTIRDNFFQNNWTGGAGVGSAIYLEYEDYPGGVTIDRCEITQHNRDHSSVAALTLVTYFQSLQDIDSLSISNCLFTDNNTGMSLQTSRIYLADCQFLNNKTAVFIDGEVDATRCYFNSNEISINLSTPFITFWGDTIQHRILNSLFIKSQKNAIQSFRPIVEVANCTFYDNKGVIQNEANGSEKGSAHFQNCIFWKTQHRLSFYNDADINFTNCLFDVIECDSINTQQSFIPNSANCFGTNIFNKYPHFTDTTNLDFTLLSCSPAINAGDNSILSQFNLPTDMAGNERILQNVIDIGAFENEQDLTPISWSATAQATCAGSQSGSLQFEIQHACEPFIIEWDGNISNALLLDSLAAGTYQFTLTDALNRIATLEVEIPELPSISLITESAPWECINNTGGSVIVTPLGGISPYTYTWQNGVTDSILVNLLPGDYTITVTDANACTDTASVIVGTEGNLPLSITVSPISCHDSEDGTAAVLPLNGTPPFEYAWASGLTDSLLTNLAGGSYTITVTDALNCMDELTFIMSAPPKLEIAIETEDVSCFGEMDGQIITSASGGTAPYFFEWNNFSQEDTLVNLAGGTYSVTLTDSRNCLDSISINIAEPSALFSFGAVKNSTCFGSNDGMVSVTPEGGTPPYDFLWETGETDSLLINLIPNNYDVTITDVNGCTFFHSFLLEEPSEILLMDHIVQHASTPDATDGAIILQLFAGGTPPFTFVWNTGAITPSIENLTPGDYSVTVTDSNDCEAVFEFIVSFISSVKAISEEKSLQVFPNPALKGGTLSIILSPKFAGEKVELALFNNTGQKIANYQRTVPELSISIPEVAGVYWLTIKINKKTKPLILSTILGVY